MGPIKKRSTPAQDWRKPNGRFDFSDMDRVCECGHTLGDHGIGEARRCLHDPEDRPQMQREAYGQAMFNHLVMVRPDLAEQIRGTDKDPFHVRHLNHPNWDRFIEFIEAEWFKEP